MTMPIPADSPMKAEILKYDDEDNFDDYYSHQDDDDNSDEENNYDCNDQ